VRLCLLLLFLFLLSRGAESIKMAYRWAGYIAGMEGMRYTCRSVMGNFVRKSPL
jgi:hypothetical protein